MFHKTERATGLEAVAERERRERGRCLLQVERVLAQAVEKRQLPADTDTALDLVRLFDDAVTTAVVVGHNPTMHSLAATLDDGEGDVEATTEMTVGTFPTSAIAVLQVEGAWADLGYGRASVRAYHVGRG